LYIKGGDVLEEIAGTHKKYTIFELSQIFEEEFFETKKIILNMSFFKGNFILQKNHYISRLKIIKN
jgi:hypothetical protein